MNENAYRARAERGEVQIGTWVTMIRTPAVLTLLQAAGLDFARVDMEHSAFSMETVDQMDAPRDHRVRRAEAARKDGKAGSMAIDSVEGVREMIARGATIVNYSSDTAVLRSGYAAAIEQIRRPAAKR